MRPCQEGYKCYYGDHYPGKVVCSLPSCVMKPMSGKAEGMLFDQLQKKVLKQNLEKR